MKKKLEKCEAEIENSRKLNEMNLLPFGSFSKQKYVYYLKEKYCRCYF